MKHLKLLIWVTSDCNLSCPLCNQAHVMTLNKGYHMGMSEVEHIVKSCKERDIRFSVIELIGGEPSMWANLEAGIEKLNDIADDIFFVTNGNNAERVMNLGLKHWIVSSGVQATTEQIKQYKDQMHKVYFNAHFHKKVPKKPIAGTIPADCVVDRSPFPPQVKETGLSYVRGRIYYCQMVRSLGDRVEITDDLVCDFEDDFIGKFIKRNFDIPQCQWCLCNSKVWKSL